MPLAALVGASETIEVWPCRGDVLPFARADLTADPARYVLVKSGKGTFKLIDTHREDAAPVRKNLAALRLVGGSATSRSP